MTRAFSDDVDARDEGGRVRVFKYVTHNMVEDYRSQGWVVISLLGQPHAEYSVLMELPAWPGGHDQQKDKRDA